MHFLMHNKSFRGPEQPSNHHQTQLFEPHLEVNWKHHHFQVTGLNVVLCLTQVVMAFLFRLRHYAEYFIWRKVTFPSCFRKKILNLYLDNYTIVMIKVWFKIGRNVACRHPSKQPVNQPRHLLLTGLHICLGVAQTWLKPCEQRGHTQDFEWKSSTQRFKSPW